MEKEKKPIKGWDLSHHCQRPIDAEPMRPTTAQETYREQVDYDYNMDKL